MEINYCGVTLVEEEEVVPLVVDNVQLVVHVHVNYLLCPCAASLEGWQPELFLELN